MAKVSVITGGGSGIGKAIIAELPKEEIVIITGRNLDKLNRTAEELSKDGHTVLATTCDVSKREEVAALAAFAASKGEISRVIHCAGVSGSMADCETIIRINALGTVYVNQEFYKVMNGGVICDIASNSGYILPGIFLPSFRTFDLVLKDEARFLKKMVKKSKMLMVGSVVVQMAYMISKNFARWYSSNCAFKYMATKGIRVFSISPGFVKTPMTDREGGDATDILLSYSGLNRGAESSELGYVVAALTDHRAGYLVGSDIICDGGCITNGYSFTNATKRYDRRSLTQNW